jgi:hypothetical protein
MVQRLPCEEDDSYRTGQAIYRFPETQMFITCLKNPETGLLSWASRIHTFFSRIYLNIILPSTPRFSKQLFPSDFPTEIRYSFITFLMRSKSRSNIPKLRNTKQNKLLNHHVCNMATLWNYE